ncbi:hypothetical protein ACLB2K_024260 [Fragaria x ananassa]
MTYTRRTRSDSTHSASAVAPLETATVPPSSVTTATIPSSATTTPPSASVIPNTDPFPPCAPGSASHTAVDFVRAPSGNKFRAYAYINTIGCLVWSNYLIDIQTKQSQ